MNTCTLSNELDIVKMNFFRKLAGHIRKYDLEKIIFSVDYKFDEETHSLINELAQCDKVHHTRWYPEFWDWYNSHEKEFSFDCFRTYLSDMGDYSKVDLIGIKGNRFYRINSDGDIFKELDREPEYAAGFVAEAESIHDAISQTEFSLNEYCDEYPDEAGCIAYKKNGSKIVLNEA